MWISYKTYNYIDTYQYSTFNLPKQLMITKPVWMLQYQERDVCTTIRAFIIALYLQAVCFLIKLQVLSEQGKKKVTCVVWGWESAEWEHCITI